MTTNHNRDAQKGTIKEMNMKQKMKRNLYGVFYRNHGKIYGPHYGEMHTNIAEAKTRAVVVGEIIQHKTFVQKLTKAEWAKA